MTNFSDVSNILPYYASRTRDLKVLVTTLTLMIRGLKTAQKNVWPGCCSDSVARLCCSFAAIGNRHNDTSEVEGHQSFCSQRSFLFLVGMLLFEVQPADTSYQWTRKWLIGLDNYKREINILGWFFCIAWPAWNQINNLHLFVIQALQATKDRCSLTFMLGDIIFSDFQEKYDMGRFLSQEQLRKWQL